jgi:hypothetical protein
MSDSSQINSQTTAIAILCHACKFYNLPDTDHLCARWHYGYGQRAPHAENEIFVENDEGWGADMGPDFGCVLGELK